MNLFYGIGIRPQVRVLALTTERKTAKAKIYDLKKHFFPNEMNFKDPYFDKSVAYDIADAQGLIEPEEARKTYKQIGTLIRSGFDLINKRESAGYTLETFFLDPEICDKIIEAETLRNPDKGQDVLDSAKKIARWLQPFHPLLSILSFCQIAKSELAIGHNKIAFQTLLEAKCMFEELDNPQTRKVHTIAFCCINAVMARALPISRLQIFEEVYEAIETADDIVMRTLAYTFFVEALNPGRSFPSPIIATRVK